uniref:Galectin n=1 Tax=Gouania willdenowi TaxID=441366 RepID=A0A8C5HV78_GOUWI
MELDLSEALGGDESGQQNLRGPSGTNPMFGGGQPTNPMFGGGQPTNPMFGGGQPTNPMFGGGQPTNPMFGGGQPTNPMFGGGQPTNPMFGGGPWPTDDSRGGGPTSGGHRTPSTPKIQQSQVTPCLLDLPAGVYNGLLLTINGRIKAHPKKFTVDLSTRNDIAFHFNPRFNDCGDRNVVVRNSCRGKRWESEERQLSHFPFTPNTNFEMKILCTNNEYKVAVNGAHLLIFKHRITNLREINKVSIYYDVENISIKAETMH